MVISSAMVLVGRIARPHGIRGHVFVSPETDFVEERFAPGSVLWLQSAGGEEALTIVASRIQNGRPVVAFEGRTTIEAIEPLVGATLWIPEDALPALAQGVYYHHQLVGCVVETKSGQQVGEVTRVEGGIGGTLLIVTGARGEVLVPFAADICTGVDVDGRRITIDAPEGLLELNEPGPPKGGPRRRDRRARRPGS